MPCGVWNYAAPAQGQAEAHGERRNGPVPGASEGTQPHPRLDLDLGLQPLAVIDNTFLLFEPPHLWDLVMAPVGN